MMNYKSKQTSYDIAHEIATKAKKVLGLSEYDQETLEHDINSLRAHEWIDLFDMIPDSNEVKKLYFTHCVELETENEQELDESMNTFTTVRTRLNRLCSPYQAQLWNNGRFEVHQVKEDDKDRLVNSLRRISKNVHAAPNNTYDFTKPAMFGGMHSQYYNIHGDIDVDFNEELLQSASDKAFQQNIKTEIDSGKSPKQAAAIAYSIQRKNECMDLEESTSINIQELVAEIVARMEDYLEYSNNVTTDIEFELPTTNNKEIKKIFALLNDRCSDKYIDYEVEDEQTYPGATYYYASLSRKYPDDYYFDYEDPETEDAQPGQRTGKYKISDKSLKESHNDQELEEDMGNKTYSVTVKYHNEPNAKIEARSAKDRKDLEYQLNMADEVEWYDFDEEQFTESLDQMREKALKMKENSNAFAILYGYRFKDKEVELEPEEFATEKEYKDRIQQITNSFTKLSDKDPRGNRHGKEHNIEFYTVYPNKKQVSESTVINNNWKVKKSRIDTKKIDSIINNLISSFPIIGSKPATIFKRHYKEKFVRYDIWLGYAVPGDAEAVEQKLLPSFEYLRDAVAPYGWKAFFEFSGYVGTDFFIQIRMPYETLENIAPIVVTESISYSDKNTNKWNIGSDKSNLTSGEIALLDELAQKLEVNSPNGYKYVVQSTYEDFGANMQWYTIVCYDKKGNSWQVLNTKDWLDLMNTGDVDTVYSEVVNGKYFQDKESYSPFKALDNLDD